MTCRKVAYDSRGDALDALTEIAPSQPPERRVRRLYCCWVCSMRERRPVWHLTSLGLTEDRRCATG